MAADRWREKPRLRAGSASSARTTQTEAAQAVAATTCTAAETSVVWSAMPSAAQTNTAVKTRVSRARPGRRIDRRGRRQARPTADRHALGLGAGALGLALLDLVALGFGAASGHLVDELIDVRGVPGPLDAFARQHP